VTNKEKQELIEEIDQCVRDCFFFYKRGMNHRPQEAKNRTVKIEEEAKQKMLIAQADAESMKIRSQALSQNKSLVEYEAVQKWNGVLPQIIMGGQSTPFIGLRGLGKGNP